MTSELEWRRTWKKGLCCRSWQTVNSEDGKTFMLKSFFKASSYEFLMTDRTFMWYEILDSDGILKRTKKLNPSVEAPVEKLVSNIQEQVDGSKAAFNFTVSYKDNEDQECPNICVTVNSKLAGLPFTWKFLGKPATSLMFAEHMTAPLLLMVAELSRQRSELIKIMARKDKEIDDYKSQGSKVTRRHLETALFQESAFNNSMIVSKEFEDLVKNGKESNFSEQNQDLYEKLMVKQSWLNRDPTEVTEEDCLGDGSVATSAGVTGQSWEGQRFPPSLIKPSSASPEKSPAKSPRKTTPKASPDPSPVKDSEILRREALEKRLAEEEARNEEKSQRKKKKLKI